MRRSRDKLLRRRHYLTNHAERRGDDGFLKHNAVRHITIPVTDGVTNHMLQSVAFFQLGPDETHIGDVHRGVRVDRLNLVHRVRFGIGKRLTICDCVTECCESKSTRSAARQVGAICCLTDSK